MRALRTRQIELYLKRQLPSSVKFLGCVPADQWPSSIPEGKASCFVSNTDCSHRGGQHWIAVFIGSTGRASYFDSYARTFPYPEWRKWFDEKCKSVTLFKKRIQKYGTYYCGYFCIYYLCNKAKVPHVNDAKLMNNVSGFDAYKFVNSTSKL